VLLVGCGTTTPPLDGAAVGDAGLSAYDDEMLRAHNMVRASASPTPSPALAPLTWSTEAASVAQQWANGCRFMHNMGSGYGENIYASTGTSSASEVVSSWASEVSSYDYAANSCSDVCGHYTQIVWRDSLQVGCATATCTTNSPFGSGSWFFVVCDYTPPGNYVGQRPY
jgi:uncharacterized protein YkwD